MIIENILKIRQEIKLITSREVTVMAVTKKQGIEKINQSISCGVTSIGENYVQEAETKLPYLLPVQKHFIGHLQSNKAKKAIEMFDCIQGCDSLEIINKINNLCHKRNKKMPIFLQVNLGHEETKYGFSIDEVGGTIKNFNEYPNVTFTGIMVVAPLGNPEENRILFGNTYNKFIVCKKICPSIKELSMGTSNDYKVATEEGSTMVRLGTAIFGERE